MSEEFVKKVLIVEDDETYRNGLKDLLSSNGYLAICAEDGEQAVENILTYRPNVILLDMLLPKIDGLEVLRRLRTYPDYEIAQIPVIVLSNLSGETDMSQTNELGISAYFVKSHTTPSTIIQQIELLFNTNINESTPNHHREFGGDFSNINYSDH